MYAILFGHMLKLILTILVLTFIFISCSLSDSGTNTFIKESSNYKRNKKAILFFKEAGATVPNSYQVTVTDYEHKLHEDEVGNTFTVDAGFDTTSVNFTWLSGDTLQIDYDRRLQIFIQEKNVDGVPIVYKAR